jgi:hypothetical protein
MERSEEHLYDYFNTPTIQASNHLHLIKVMIDLCCWHRNWQKLKREWPILVEVTHSVVSYVDSDSSIPSSLTTVVQLHSIQISCLVFL